MNIKERCVCCNSMSLMVMKAPILGLQACQELNPIQRVDQIKPITIESIMQEYSDVLNNETLGCLPV